MTHKKTATQLDKEIAEALAAAPVTISVHEDDDDETGETTYTVSDDGGEYDEDDMEENAPDVQGDIDERRWHYQQLGRRVVLDAPAGRGWY
jgi:hypothetical protein